MICCVGRWVIVGSVVMVCAAAAASPGTGPGLSVSQVTASSAMPADSGRRYLAANLIDGDRGSTWRPAGASPHFAWVRIDLAKPARVDGLIIDPGRVPGGRVDRAGRLRRAWVLFDDGTAEVIRLDPAREGPRWLLLSRAHMTRSVTLVVRDFELGDRWNHLEIAELSVTGSETKGAPQPPSAGDSAWCGSPGWVPLRDAVVRRCGAPEHAASCEDPLLDVVLRCRSDPGRSLVAFAPSDGAARASWSYSGRFFGFEVELRGDGPAWQVTAVKFTDHSASAR